jgi:TonB family protein
MVRSTQKTRNSADGSRARYRGTLPIRFLLISLAAHAGVFLVGRKVDLWPFPPPSPELFHVRLLREQVDAPPRNQDTADSETVHADSFQFQKEDTIRLEDEKGEYADYARLIKQRLASTWIYPAQAKRQSLEGTVVMKFTIERDGGLSGSKLISSSKHGCLDENVVDAITRAAPYPPFPDNFTISRLHIEASFAYRLASRERED